MFTLCFCSTAPNQQNRRHRRGEDVPPNQLSQLPRNQRKMNDQVLTIYLVYAVFPIGKCRCMCLFLSCCWGCVGIISNKCLDVIVDRMVSNNRFSGHKVLFYSTLKQSEGKWELLLLSADAYPSFFALCLLRRM